MQTNIPTFLMPNRSRYAFQSPSVSDEKGAYRMRPPRSSRPGSNLSDPSSRVYLHVPYRRTRRIVVLVAFLACGALACFAYAYWLLTTRYSQSVRTHSLGLADPSLNSRRVSARRI